jgi:CheY-like chemotaxis protein
VPLSDEGKRQILARLKLVEPILQGSRILWVDDNPNWQVRERNFLHVIGIGVDCAQTNQAAYNLMEAQNTNQTPYDLVISDVGRDHEGNETGFTLLAGIRARGYSTNVIFYSPSPLPKPPEAYAMTHYTDILLNDVFDVLELQRTLRPDVQNAILDSKSNK